MKILRWFATLVAGIAVFCGAWLAVGLARPLDPVPLFGTAHGTVAITDVTIIDVAGGAAIPGQTVLIEQGRIVRIGSAASVTLPPGAHRITGTDRYLIPGLWDAHSHTLRHSPRVHFPLLLAHGVTSIRNMGDGCSWNVDLACLPDAQEWPIQGEGVRRLVPHSPTFASFHFEELPPAEELDGLVSSLKQRGDSFVKLQLPDDAATDQIHALIAAAARAGQPVAGHVPPTIDLLHPAAGRWLSIEHGDQLVDQCATLRIVRNWLQDDCAPLLAHLAQAGTAFVPTFVASTGQDVTLGRDRAAEDARLDYVPAPVAWIWSAYRSLDRAGFSDKDLIAAKERHARTQRVTLAAKRAGVAVLAGTDSLDPFVLHGSSMADELAMLVDAGFTPSEALRAATLLPAQHSGLAGRYGAVQVGAQADLVLLTANPLSNIAAVRQIDHVFARGLTYDQADLTQMKRFAKDQAGSHALSARMWWALLGG